MLDARICVPVRAHPYAFLHIVLQLAPGVRVNPVNHAELMKLEKRTMDMFIV